MIKQMKGGFVKFKTRGRITVDGGVTKTASDA